MNKKLFNLTRIGGSSLDYVELEKKSIDELTDKLRSAITSEDLSFEKEKVLDFINLFQNNGIDFINNYIGTFKQNIIEGKIYISDDESIELGKNYSSISIELKMELVSILDSINMFSLMTLANVESLKLEKYSEQFIALIIQAVKIARNIELLTNHSNMRLKKSLFQLTFENLIKTK